MKIRFSLGLLLLGLGLWGLVAAVAGPAFLLPGFLGMIAPVVLGMITVELITRQYDRDPRKVTKLMIGSFGVKMVVYALYVVLVFQIPGLSAYPFIFSFTGFFILLHILEALYFRAKFQTNS
ncbi:MAG: hypothetical protein D6762_03865 [Candidatus Neomarinimicrobiota bacterium]|nr:MAG: hypothetical protein D6762_03865 [Candidatus Neomarinimicrobiota bacterium]